MELKQNFIVRHDLDTVWDALCDAPFAVQCLPGAELEPSNDDTHYRGTMKIKLGPLSALFAGDAVVERDVVSKTGTVHWTGSDTRSNSRAKATMVYQLSPSVDQNGTNVDITADVVLTGSLAQFGRSGIIQDVAGRLTAIFAENLQQLLNETQRESPSAQAHSANAGSSNVRPAPRLSGVGRELRALPLVISIFRTRCGRLLRRWADWIEGTST